MHLVVRNYSIDKTTTRKDIIIKLSIFFQLTSRACLQIRHRPIVAIYIILDVWQSSTRFFVAMFLPLATHTVGSLKSMNEFLLHQSICF